MIRSRKPWLVHRAITAPLRLVRVARYASDAVDDNLYDISLALLCIENGDATDGTRGVAVGSMPCAYESPQASFPSKN